MNEQLYLNFNESDSHASSSDANSKRRSLEKGEALLLKKTVTSEIISNASWNLAVNNRKLTEFTVLIKRSDQNRDGWQQISNQTAYFSGANGRQKVAFDIKIKLPKAEQISESGRKSLSLGFTIGH